MNTFFLLKEASKLVLFVYYFFISQNLADLVFYIYLFCLCIYKQKLEPTEVSFSIMVVVVENKKPSSITAKKSASLLLLCAMRVQFLLVVMRSVYLNMFPWLSQLSEEKKNLCMPLQFFPVPYLLSQMS